MCPSYSFFLLLVAHKMVDVEVPVETAEEIAAAKAERKRLKTLKKRARQEVNAAAELQTPKSGPKKEFATPASTPAASDEEKDDATAKKEKAERKGRKRLRRLARAVDEAEKTDEPGAKKRKK